MRTLKISTLIKGILITLCSCIILISAYSLKSLNDANKAFQELQVTTEKIRKLRNITQYLNDARGDINFVHNDAALAHDVLDRKSASINEQLTKARRSLEIFNSIHDTDEGRAKLTENLSQKIGNLIEAYAGNVRSLENYVNTGFNNGAKEVELAQANDEYNGYSVQLSNEVVNDFDNRMDTTQFVIGVMLLLSTIASFIAWIIIKKSVFERLSSASVMLEKIGSGELYHKFEIGARNEIGHMLESLLNMKTSLTATISSVRSTSELINTDSSEIDRGNENLASRTEQQASALQQTAASMEEIKTTVASNAENARQANELAHQARSTANSGSTVMHDVVNTMEKISLSARKISEINSVIDGIANQTNILALNAAVEAARAGEQGRGFSVVATEVRNLAKRSADAAKEISLLINQSVKNVDDGSKLIENAGQTMQEIVTAVTHVSDIMQEITQASEEQSTGVGQIASAVNEMDLATQQNAILVQESSQITHSLNQRARELYSTVSLFQLDPADIPKKEPVREFANRGKSRISNAEKMLIEKKVAVKNDDNWTEF